MKHVLFAYLIPLWIFVLTILVVGSEFHSNEWNPNSELSHDWTKLVITASIVGGAGYFMATLVYIPYAVEIVDLSFYLMLLQALLWAIFAILWYSFLQEQRFSPTATFRELVWFGRDSSPPFDCCFFGAFFVPAWFIMAMSGMIFWRQLSGTVKIANVLFITMVVLLLITYIFPPST